MSKRFGAVVAVDAVDLEVAAGEVMALVGPSGSGKTTVLRMVAGFVAPDAGTIRVGGRVVAGAGRPTPPERRSVGLVFQLDSCFPHLTVLRNVGFGLRATGRRERRARAEALIELVGLGGLGSRYPHELSGGQRQRVAIARALAPRPAVLLLDEPFAHLDAALRAGLRAELRQVLAEEGCTGVLVTHDQEEALSTADRVAVMAEGRVLQCGRPQEVFRAPASPTAAVILGAADLLPARVHAGRLLSELGELVPASPAPEGARVLALLRPDQVAVRDDPAGTARVRGVRFLGAEVAYALELPSGATVGGRARHREPLAPGTPVRLEVVDADVPWFTAPEAADPPTEELPADDDRIAGPVDLGDRVQQAP